MNELDMSRPGSELFPESQGPAYNSYQDVNTQGQAVDDPLDMGVTSPAAMENPMSDKEMNFRALGDVVSKLKEEREYWKGQAEALTKTSRAEPSQSEQLAPETLDWDDGKDVKRAFEAIRQENERLRHEMRDQLAALETKASHQDWNTLVTQHVPELTSKNPMFAEMIQKASNPYEAAYLLAELRAGSSQAAAPVQPNPNAQRALQNSQKPQTLASVGGRGQLSSADYYASMSDADFMKIAAKNLADI